MAAMVTVSRVPREPSATMILTTVSLFGASRMLMKSYFPRRAYCWMTLAPILVISLLTSFKRSGLLFRVLRPSWVSFDITTYTPIVSTVVILALAGNITLPRSSRGFLVHLHVAEVEPEGG